METSTSFYVLLCFSSRFERKRYKFWKHFDGFPAESAGILGYFCDKTRFSNVPVTHFHTPLQINIFFLK